MNNYTLTAT